ncbi:bifunctional UDP-sugar hydrolase/5'-nucleotidase [Flavobacterium sp. NRK1]|uniref:bifunctional metallophosphatase/5'-nucleotidase n=1 Tax=Flavobacterium sp. NRK1 TaxID=2954929 RepID=UPI00209252BB|nr:metallophosphatase [Flavobacterium sp. NRK1]MCO6146497.1 metallophosphatase [Flavobacterium sp. NRK1]
MKRRDFIQKTAAGSALVLGGLSLSSFAAPDIKKITILHTNDVHSHIDPFPVDDPKYPNLGGAARRATAIEQIRLENPNTLLLDAGDIFQGTPYFNYYGGELEFELMSMMQYDLATLGNHDFDNGLEGFHKQLPHASFDFVSANYDFKNTILDGLIKPYKIFIKDGIKIGIFGLGIAFEGLVDKKNYKETVYNDPISVAQDMARTLRHTEKCNLIICLSHLGFIYRDEPSRISDLTLARNTKDIDLIIGGHTHTFLTRPYIQKNSVGKEVLINQVGCYGLNLGQIDFYFEEGRMSSSARTILV